MGYVGRTCGSLALLALATPIVLEENYTRNEVIKNYVEASAFNTLADFDGCADPFYVASGIANGMPKFGRKAKTGFIKEKLTGVFSGYTTQEKAAETAGEIADGVPESIRAARMQRYMSRNGLPATPTGFQQAND